MSILAGFWHVVNFLWAGFGAGVVVSAAATHCACPGRGGALAWLVATGWAVLGLVWEWARRTRCHHRAGGGTERAGAWWLAKRGR